MPRYAVIFRTHFWDDFARRQFARLQARTREGDIFVLVDETNGEVSGIEHDRVVRMTEGDVIGMGLARAGTGNLLWFNGDYPLYLFQQLNGNYDYYLQLEYDVVFNTDIDALVARAAEGHVDFIGLSKGDPIEAWFWASSCEGVYPIEQTEHQLICASLFSSRALDFLRDRRLELSRIRAAGKLPNWPYCEAFIPTELRRAGFVCESLANYGDTGSYDHWPPFLERDLPEMSGNFLHPVLDDVRYAGSLLKYRIGLKGYLQPNSLFHRKARRLPPMKYLRLVVSSFVGKARRAMRPTNFTPISMKEAA